MFVGEAEPSFGRSEAEPTRHSQAEAVFVSPTSAGLGRLPLLAGRKATSIKSPRQHGESAAGTEPFGACGQTPTFVCRDTVWPC